MDNFNSNNPNPLDNQSGQNQNPASSDPQTNTPPTAPAAMPEVPQSPVQPEPAAVESAPMPAPEPTPTPISETQTRTEPNKPPEPTIESTNNEAIGSAGTEKIVGEAFTSNTQSTYNPEPAPIEAPKNSESPLSAGNPPLTSADEPQHVDVSQPTYNEYLKPKKNMTLIILILGIVLLALAAGGYVYYMIMSGNNPFGQPAPAEPEQTVEEQPVEEPVVEEQPLLIEEDPMIQELNELNTSQESATGIGGIEGDLNSLDFEGIDTDLQSQGF